MALERSGILRAICLICRLFDIIHYVGLGRWLGFVKDVFLQSRSFDTDEPKPTHVDHFISLLGHFECVFLLPGLCFTLFLDVRAGLNYAMLH